MAVKTKKPTGLTMTRSGNYIVNKWKIADEDYYDGQIAQFKKSTMKKWSAIRVTTVTTQKSISIDPSLYYPTKSTKLTSVSFRVKGNRRRYTVNDGRTETTVDPILSDYTTKTYSIDKPNAPSLSVALSSQSDNTCVFSWTTAVDNTSSKWFVDVEWQTILVEESPITDGSKLSWSSRQTGWETGSSTANNSKTIVEDTARLARASHTRWFRVRSRGIAGASEWKYHRHVYARPYQAKVKSARVTTTSAGGYMCTVRWAAPASMAHPIDLTTVQYTIVVPEAGLTCPDSASWNNASVTRDSSGDDAASFSIDSQVSTDQCLFVRVNNKHDNNITYGIATLATSGALSAPSGLTVNMDQSTHRASVTATNNSANSSSFLVVRYMTAADAVGFDIGVIPHGATSVTVQCPVEPSGRVVVFGVYAVVGSYTPITRADGISSVAVAATLKSALVKQGGDIPVAPSNVTLSMTDTLGTIRVQFDWAWRAATSAELSWADHEDAWESTAQPTTYVIDNTKASQWNISGLATGKTWYVRVRLASGSGDGKTFGAYSEIRSIDLTSAPAIPILSLSESVITDHGSVTASWVYSTGDGSAQATAELAEVTTVNGNLVYTPIATARTATHITINAADVGWVSGETHALAVSVVSASGRRSDGWSDPVTVSVAEPLSIAISQTSLVENTVTEDDVERTFNALTAMPLTVTVTGAGTSGTTSVVVERAQSYYLDRPDESQVNGYEGETIAIATQTGESQITFTLDDLVGRLDDGAPYRIVATVKDSLGQSAETSLDFEVDWTHQAIIPEVDVESDTRALITKITPIAPTGALLTDVCDIYRLSVDRPQLIYEGAEFGVEYVDPFPALGEFGGHRIVFRTENGDYITADNHIAWADVSDRLPNEYSIIDFGGGRIRINRNLDVSNSWKKDFTETKYLGGAVQGDWNPAVSREATVNTVAVTIKDQENIQAMRRLATYAGICHIRTSEGSSYTANVDVSEDYKHNTGRMVAEYTLSITRVDPEALDGMTYEEWLDGNDDYLRPEVGIAVVGRAVL